MTNKLVVITNSLKVSKIKKILLYEIKFLVPNYSCLQNPWLGGYRPQIPVLSVLCPQLNLLNPPPKKIPGYATDYAHLQEDKCISIASGIVTLFRWLFSTQVTTGPSRNLCTERSPKKSDNTGCYTNTIVLLKMSIIVLETCRGL